MKRILVMYVLFNTCVLVGMIPTELQEKINALNLQDVQISYQAEAHCAAVIGLQQEEKKAFFAFHYSVSDTQSRWTNLTPIPFNQENDVLGLFCQGNKVLTIQSSSALNHTNAIGYQISFNSETAGITMHLVDTSRFIMGSADAILLFSPIYIEPAKIGIMY